MSFAGTPINCSATSLNAVIQIAPAWSIMLICKMYLRVSFAIYAAACKQLTARSGRAISYHTSHIATRRHCQ
jgi:hypothetical protein